MIWNNVHKLNKGWFLILFQIFPEQLHFTTLPGCCFKKIYFSECYQLCGDRHNSVYSPICGTDYRTYLNPCQLLRFSCQSGYKIGFQSVGHCQGKCFSYTNSSVYFCICQLIYLLFLFYFFIYLSNIWLLIYLFIHINIRILSSGH